MEKEGRSEGTDLDASNKIINISPLLILNDKFTGIMKIIINYLPNPLLLKGVCERFKENQDLKELSNDRIKEIKRNQWTKSEIIIKFWTDIQKHLTTPGFWIPIQQLFQNPTFYISYIKDQNFSSEFKEIDLTNENLKKLKQLSRYNNKENIPPILEMPSGLNFEGKPTESKYVIDKIKNKNNVFILSVFPFNEALAPDKTDKIETGYNCLIQ